MGFLKKIGLFILIVAVIIGYLTKDLFNDLPAPNLPKNEYWGPGQEPKNVDESIRPFKIVFSEEMIQDLRQRLDKTRFVEPYEGIGFQYGMNQNALKPIVKYWSKEYDFAKQEKHLNMYPQFKTTIQGLDIHFIHVKPEKSDKKVLPLLLLHGWPGSVAEFYKILPLLTTSQENYDFVFEVIAPSLPGFGFSQAASRPGLSPIKMGFVLSNLMKRLGHEKYYIQGGDWGSIICSSMSTLLQDEILGYHSNFPFIQTPLSILKMHIGSIWPSMFLESELIHRMYPLGKKFSDAIEESGYLHIQATKPDTIGVALNDSPAALAAWILQIFSVGTNLEYKSLSDGGLTKKFTLDELINNLMFYWVNKSATSAARIYSEHFNKNVMGYQLDRVPTDVPYAAARFPHEIIFQTEWQLKAKFHNLIHIADYPKGGHFAAMEVPELLAEDINIAVKKFIEFHSNKK